MSPHAVGSRVVAIAMLVAVSAGQLMPLPCMMKPVPAAEPAAVASHEHHHGSSQQSPPIEDHTQPTESSHAGQTDCTMMLSCVMVMAVPQSVPVEAVLELSPDGHPSSSHPYVGPLLNRLTPPPRTA